MYFNINLNFSKFNKSAFVGEWTIYRFNNARCKDKTWTLIYIIYWCLIQYYEFYVFIVFFNVHFFVKWLITLRRTCSEAVNAYEHLCILNRKYLQYWSVFSKYNSAKHFKMTGGMPKYSARWHNYKVTVKYVHTHRVYKFYKCSNRLGDTSKFQESEG